MNAASLQAILAQELAIAGVRPGCRRVGQMRRTHWSKKLPGFGVRHYRSGKRVYVVQVRINGAVRTITICNAKFVPERVATDVARRVILRSQVGENPADEKKRVRTLPPFDRFLATYWACMAPTWKPSTRQSHDIYRRNKLDGAFTGKMIDTIDVADVQRWYADIAERSGPGAANRALEILSALMNKAEEWRARPEGTNPCREIRKFRKRKVERFLDDAELGRLGAALELRREGSPFLVAALTLIMLTGCRYSEIVSLTWGEVNGLRLKLRDSKTGPRTVWLGSEARAVLDRLKRRSGDELVFPGNKPNRPVALATFWTQIRIEAGLASVRIHDLRHTFASRAASMSETLPMIGKLLGHRRLDSTARYAHLDDKDVVQDAQRIGDLIEVMSGHILDIEPMEKAEIEGSTLPDSLSVDVHRKYDGLGLEGVDFVPSARSLPVRDRSLLLAEECILGI